MKRYVIFGIVMTIGLSLWNGFGCGNNSTPTPTVVTITIPSGAAGMGTAAYGADPLHVALGSQVVWKNEDNMIHTATSDTGIWDTDFIGPDASSDTVTFNTAGTFPYHCTIHGTTSMSGTIIVP